MNTHELLVSLLIYLGAAIVAVPIAKRFGLGAVLGYMAAGAILGPFGLRLIHEVESVRGLAEVGVVLLLFVIGLELKISRLWVMRRAVFGLGGAQVGLTAVPIFAVAWAVGLPLGAGVIVAISLAFSSTAFALQILGERRQLATRFGRASFAILLFQDLAAIPLIAAVPMMADGAGGSAWGSAWDGGALVSILKTGGVLLCAIAGGRYLLRPLFRLVASTKTDELFTAAALFLVLGVAVFMEKIGLSMALGSFLAGVLLADSEYRHELEADIEPFKGLLLGLFFMTVGMSVDLGLLASRPFVVFGSVLALVGGKFAVNYGVARWHGLAPEPARALAAVLCQGGEFAFVVFAAAVAGLALDPAAANLLVVIVALSMAATPLMVLLNDRVLSRFFGGAKQEYDEIRGDEAQVIIAGFGRFGQIVGRTLRVLRIGFVALEKDANQVEVLRKFGSQVYYGDASKLDLLKAARADRAEALVVAIDDVASSLKTVAVAREHFPDLKIFARARNRQHAYELLDLGVERIWRETFASSVEMTQSLLVELGVPEVEADRTMVKFRQHDERMLREQHLVHKDESKLIDVSKRSAQLLSELLSTDREEDDGKRSAGERELGA